MGMHKSGGTKKRGRHPGTTKFQADPTRPELPVNQGTEVNRGGPGQKNMNKDRGDRRDTGPRSY